MDMPEAFNQVFDEYMELKIFVDSDDDELKQKYCAASVNHNTKLFSDPHHYDAGFDIYSTEYVDHIHLLNYNQHKLDHKIKCCANIIKIQSGHRRGTAFYTYARSSITKTIYRLANNQGIIDAGYRGNLISVLDVKIDSNGNCSQKYERIIQICAPNLLPIVVIIVDKLEDLGCETSRGTGGFGSTGV